MKKPLTEWHILSPNGASIFPFGSSSEDEAWKLFEDWKKRFEQQGYYSTVKDGERFRIPLNELKGYCKAVEQDMILQTLEEQSREHKLFPIEAYKNNN